MEMKLKKNKRHQFSKQIIRVHEHKKREMNNSIKTSCHIPFMNAFSGAILKSLHYRGHGKLYENAPQCSKRM